MKDLYSFDSDEVGLDASYRRVSQAYKNIYARLGLPTLMIEADSGAIGGKESHEFMVLTETGEDEIIRCSNCRYAANAEKAKFVKTVGTAVAAGQSSGHSEEKAGSLLPLEEIATPGTESIEEVADFVGVPANQTIKGVFYYAGGEFVFVAIRGDLEVNETKLRNVLKCSELRLATEGEVDEAGIVAGFASPIGVKGVRVVADDSITSGYNFVVGANKPGYHFKNANYPRDFRVDSMADMALARPGDSCPQCGAELSVVRGIEVGHVFKLGTFISDRFGASFLDSDGKSRPTVMGCYGIGLGRLLAAIVECSHDGKGIIWPLSVAPYQVHLCALYLDEPAVLPAAEGVYQELQKEGIEVLLDDRAESPGVKFNDADLLGIPLRLTLSPRTLRSEGIEAKWRTQKEMQIVPLENSAVQVRKLLNECARSQGQASSGHRD
jgi:prolyl-tRNA synthetase